MPSSTHTWVARSSRRRAGSWAVVKTWTDVGSVEAAGAITGCKAIPHRTPQKTHLARTANPPCDIDLFGHLDGRVDLRNALFTHDGHAAGFFVFFGLG